MTLCFSANQALLAGLAGAWFVSPFVGRLDDISQDGMALVREIAGIYDRYKFETKIIAASIRHPLHCLEAARAGSHIATVPFKVLEQMMTHPLTEAGNARVLADRLLENKFDLVSGGTDNHLMMVKLIKEGITGKVADETLERAGITLNKNMIPFDPATPFVTSGIRIGTPAMTTRGMKEKEMVQIADLITSVIRDIKNEETIADVRKQARELCGQFPLYPDLT
jgi:hypothetical protein